MSYEYEAINRAIVQQNGVDNNINRANSLQELDEVYAKAEKLPEYEAKAKAFDAYHSIISNHIEQQYSHNKHDMVKRFVKIHDEYERGESE